MLARFDADCEARRKFHLTPEIDHDDRTLTDRGREARNGMVERTQRKGTPSLARHRLQRKSVRCMGSVQTLRSVKR